MHVLMTSRLILRPLEMTDAAAVQAGFPRWEIVRYLDAVVPWPYPPDGASTYIGQLCLPGMRRGEEWHWSLRRRADPEQLIGVISLRRKPGDNRGFWLDPVWQGQGLMAEACEAVTDFWFGELHQPLLQVVKAVANGRSRRMSVRTGMRVIETFEYDFVCGRMQAELWEMTRAEWLERSEWALSPGSGATAAICGDFAPG